MKKKLTYLFSAIILMACLSSCNSNSDVSVNGSSINITIPARTVGIGGINRVSYGGANISDINAEVYDLFCGFLSCWGWSMSDTEYSVNLYYTATDQYGNKKRGYVGEIGHLFKSEVKKYNSGYFHLVSDMIYNASNRYPNSYDEDVPFNFPFHKYFGILVLIGVIIFFIFSIRD